MVNQKNSLNLKPIKKTLHRSVSSRKNIDGIIKKENFDNKIKLVAKENIKTEAITQNSIADKQNEINNASIDDTKRMFLKVAGVAGLGLAASALFPKGADAYVSGSTPTSNVVGIKNIANAKINPATEDGNLASIKINTDKLTFDVNGNLLTASTGGSAEVVGIKNSANTRINPATEEGLANVGNSVNDQSVWMLRKILTLLKPLGMTTGAGSNRLSVDINSGTVTVSTISTVTTVSTVSSMTNMVNIGNVNAFSLMKDTARNNYANSIRSQISF